MMSSTILPKFPTFHTASAHNGPWAVHRVLLYSVPIPDIYHCPTAHLVNVRPHTKWVTHFRAYLGLEALET